jgi:hypothetical protein
LYQPGGSPMIVNAMHEQSVQQITFCRLGVFSSTNMLVMLRLGEAELHNGGLSVLQNRR